MTIRIEDIEKVDFSDIATGETIGPVAPGDVLKHDFMAPVGLSARALAKAVGVPVNRITAIINGQRAVTAETAILLGEFFRVSPRMWLGLQMAHDLEIAQSRHRAHRHAA